MSTHSSELLAPKSRSNEVLDSRATASGSDVCQSSPQCLGTQGLGLLKPEGFSWSSHSYLGKERACWLASKSKILGTAMELQQSHSSSLEPDYLFMVVAPPGHRQCVVTPGGQGRDC